MILKIEDLFKNYFQKSDTMKGQKKRYIERVLKNLSEVSETKINLDNFKNFKDLDNDEFDNLLNSLKKLIAEWYYKDLPENYRIVSDERGKCELCNKIDSVYQFKIVNYLNNNFLWVGSSCILNFCIEVKDSQSNTIDRDKEKIFNKRKITESERITAVNKFLKFMYNEVNQKYNEGFAELKPYKPSFENTVKGIFTIKQVKYLSLLFRKYSIDDSLNNGFISRDLIKLFKVNMKLKVNKDAVKDKSFTEFHFLQFEPILNKSFYCPEYGFDLNSRDRCMKIYLNYNYKGVKDYNRLIRKFENASKEERLVPIKTISDLIIIENNGYYNFTIPINTTSDIPRRDNLSGSTLKTL